MRRHLELNPSLETDFTTWKKVTADSPQFKIIQVRQHRHELCCIHDLNVHFWHLETQAPSYPLTKSMNAASYYLKHPAMQYVWTRAYVTTPSMQTQQSVKTLGLPNLHLTLHRKRFTQPGRKTIKASLLDDQKRRNNSEKCPTKEEIPVLAEPNRPDLVLHTHSSALTDMLRHKQPYLCIPREFSVLHPNGRKTGNHHPGMRTCSELRKHRGRRASLQPFSDVLSVGRYCTVTTCIIDSATITVSSLLRLTSLTGQANLFLLVFLIFTV